MAGRMRSYRALASIALCNLHESELKALYEMMQELSFSHFVEVVREVEDEIEESVASAASRHREYSGEIGKSMDNFYREIDRIRKKQMGLSVADFADKLTFAIQNYDPSKPVTRFDPRRGLRMWLSKLVRQYGESELLHILSRIQLDSKNARGSDWPIR